MFNDINLLQAHKITCYPRSEFGEITWHYPSAGSTENDKYVTLNYLSGHWWIGSLERTCGADRGVSPYPLAMDASGNLYRHEFGTTRLATPTTICAPKPNATACRATSMTSSGSVHPAIELTRV